MTKVSIWYIPQFVQIFIALKPQFVHLPWPTLNIYEFLSNTSTQQSGQNKCLTVQAQKYLTSNTVLSFRNMRDPSNDNYYRKLYLLVSTTAYVFESNIFNKKLS